MNRPGLVAPLDAIADSVVRAKPCYFWTCSSVVFRLQSPYPAQLNYSLRAFPTVLAQSGPIWPCTPLQVAHMADVVGTVAAVIHLASFTLAIIHGAAKVGTALDGLANIGKKLSRLLILLAIVQSLEDWLTAHPGLPVQSEFDRLRDFLRETYTEIDELHRFCKKHDGQRRSKRARVKWVLRDVRKCAPLSTRLQNTLDELGIVVATIHLCACIVSTCVPTLP